MEALAAFSDRLVLSLKVNRGRLGTACKLARRRQPQQPPLEGPPQQPVPRDSPLLCALDLAQASSADVFAELTGAFCNDTAPTRVQASRLVVEAARGRRLQHQLLLMASMTLERDPERWEECAWHRTRGDGGGGAAMLG